MSAGRASGREGAKRQRQLHSGGERDGALVSSLPGCLPYGSEPLRIKHVGYDEKIIDSTAIKHETFKQLNSYYLNVSNQ